MKTSHRTAARAPSATWLTRKRLGRAGGAGV